MDEPREVTESEREAVEASLKGRFGAPLAEGRWGASPYARQGVVFGPAEAKKRGARVSLAPVARSHDGAGNYKGRGRWRDVYLLGPSPDGHCAVCAPGDRGAEEVGASGLHIRPWALEAEAQASAGLGEAAGPLAAALAALGLMTEGGAS